jgi:putative transposase
MEIFQGITTVAEASRAIGDWIHLYNHQRPHQALGMKTHNEVFNLAV